MNTQEKRIANIRKYLNTYESLVAYGVDWNLSVKSKEECAKSGRRIAKLNEKFFRRFQIFLESDGVENWLIDTDEQFAIFDKAVRVADNF